MYRIFTRTYFSERNEGCVLKRPPVNNTLGVIWLVFIGNLLCDRFRFLSFFLSFLFFFFFVKVHFSLWKYLGIWFIGMVNILWCEMIFVSSVSSHNGLIWMGKTRTEILPESNSLAVLLIDPSSMCIQLAPGKSTWECFFIYSLFFFVDNRTRRHNPSSTKQKFSFFRTDYT